MSSVESNAPSLPEPKKSPQDPSRILTDAERNAGQKFLANPLDFPPEFRAWLEDVILASTSTAGSLAQVAAAVAWPIGTFRIIPDDLSAQTGVYEWTDDYGLVFLYCNLDTASYSQTTYADLYAKLGANKYGADSGGNFKLFDCRGRTAFFAGTHADMDLGDNDGVTETSRRAKHTHSNSLGITDPGHLHSVFSVSGGPDIASGAGYNLGGSTTTGTATTGISISGSVGTGMSGSDAVAHTVIGSLLIRAR